MDETLGTRANGVSPAEYERAYSFVVEPERAKAIVADMFARLEASSEHNISLDPKFIALLALFCQSGRDLAATLLSPQDVQRYQRELANEYESVAAEFPSLTNEDR